MEKKKEKRGKKNREFTYFFDKKIICSKTEPKLIKYFLFAASVCQPRRRDVPSTFECTLLSSFLSRFAHVQKSIFRRGIATKRILCATILSFLLFLYPRPSPPSLTSITIRYSVFLSLSPSITLSLSLSISKFVNYKFNGISGFGA